jgi:uncharacterized protein YPO0396
MQSQPPELALNGVGVLAPRPGWRLKRLEIRNWGTFNNQVHLVVPDAGWTLLVGENGSGKSTAADALRTLLVPPRLVKDSYNDASGATKGRDRSRRSYILGAWGSQGQEDSIKGVTKYLRTEKDISTMLAVFVNEALKKSLTLAQLLWLHGDSIHELFAVSQGDRSIKADLSDFGSGQVREFRTKLEKRDFETYKSFSGYSQRFMSAMSIPGEEALEVFNQAIGVKDVADVNVFIRRHMLEPSDAVEFIDDTLRPHFTELTRCWESIETAKRQLAQLNPIAEAYYKIETADGKRAVLDDLSKAVPFYYASQHLTLRRDQEKDLNSKIGVAELDHADLKKQDASESGKRDEIIQALGKDEVANLLASVEKELDDTLSRAAEKKNHHQQFTRILGNLGIIRTIESNDDFTKASEQLAALNLRLETEQSEIREKSQKVAIEINDKTSRIEELTRELHAAMEHKVSIPADYLRIRSELCHATSLPADDLPFAGELIEVKDEFSAWRGAIEKLLHSFAISMVVPARHYHAVSQWVDSHNLRNRFVFLLVVERSQQQISGSIPANRVAARLNFKRDHFLHAWVATEVSNRFRHICVDNTSELQRENYALTQNGLMKEGTSRHVKDDRRRIDDPSNWVLGWSAENKIRLLEQTLNQLSGQKEDAKARDRALKNRGNTVQGQIIAVANLQTIGRFEAIDYLSEERASLTLTRRRDELREQAEPIKHLLAQKKEIEDRIAEIQEQVQTKIKEISSLQTTLGTCQDHIAELDAELKTQPQFLAGAYRQRMEEFQESPELTLQNVERVRSAVLRKIQTQLKEQEGIISEAKDKILPKMQDFLRDYPHETAELRAEMDYAKEFVQLRDQLDTEKLPQYRDRFRSFLDENLLSSLANFRAKLEEDENNIKKRIIKVNEALRNIQFSESTYVEIRESRAHNEEITIFRKRLSECFEGTLGDSDQAREAVLEKIRLLMDDFDKRDDWKRRVTDVRNWLEFAVSEKDRQTGKEVNYVAESSGRSGGQKAKMAFTILASAIMSQYGMASDKPDANTFRLVVIDEAFSRTDEENSRQALDLFQKLGLQLVVVSPFDARARLVEDYVDTFHLATNPTRDASRISRASRAEYEAARDSAPADANGN